MAVDLTHCTLNESNRGRGLPKHLEQVAAELGTGRTELEKRTRIDVRACRWIATVGALRGKRCAIGCIEPCLCRRPVPWWIISGRSSLPRPHRRIRAALSDFSAAHSLELEPPQFVKFAGQHLCLELFRGVAVRVGKRHVRLTCAPRAYAALSLVRVAL